MGSPTTDSPSEHEISSVKIRCLLAGGTDPLTRNLRSGVALRFHNPPKGVSYDLRMERLGYPSYLGYYSMKPLTTPLSVARLFAEAVFPLGEKAYSLVHSFYWSLHRYRVPWIHENDQSLSQLLSGYVKLNGFPQRRIVELASALINSRMCKSVVVWSEWAKKGYAEDGVDRSKIRVIPPPFPMIHDRKRHDNVNILFLGRDYKRKGGDTALSVFRELRKEFENIHLIYIGKIRDPIALKQIVQDKQITYFESVSQHVLLSEIFPVADIFLLPCRAEAFGMSLVEVLSRGIPVVSSKISAIPEIVRDRITGFLNDPLDLQAFVSSTEKLVEEKTRKEMGTRAAQSVQEKYSPDEISLRLLETYLNSLD
ncbi:MAG: glycosyltransferase family 4 protein [Nitrososphaerota archaeon]|nr:glycosyltransferase family 4 protein [Nitrososphaerota archaeon]